MTLRDRLLRRKLRKASPSHGDANNLSIARLSIDAPSSATPLSAAPSTPSSSNVAPLSGTSQTHSTLPPWSAETLWKDAYEKLKQNDLKLIQSFEKASGVQSNLPDQIQSVVKQRLDKREEHQWIIAVAGRSVKVRENGERLIKFILWSKDVVGDALSSQPHMALAWSGVTMLLPLALTPSEESDAMIAGLDHLASLMKLYEVRTRLRDETIADEYRDAIVQLYSCILGYQANMVCHLSDGNMTRAIHSLTQSGRWKRWLKEIDNADQYCQQHEVLIDKDEERTLCKHQMEQIEKSTQIQKQILEAMREVLAARAADREDDRQREILHSFAADYSGQKNFNRPHVPKTCRWFLDDPRFHRWRDARSSSLLWLSTGPGCGKSVLSRALIDEKLLTDQLMTATVCYFFFKDGQERRQRGEDALCSILHQLYSQNLASNLISRAYEPFKSNGLALRSMFYPLWELLIATARDTSAGEIICLLDALDECQTDAREQLLDQLQQLFNDPKVADSNGPRIKFLITSRPNRDIKLKFSHLISTVNFIEFAGDDKSALINREINLVIDQSIPDIVPELDLISRSKIVTHLKSMQQRTYLWLHLVLKEIQCKFSSHTTVKDLEALIAKLPDSVTQAYENILNQSSDQQAARTILKIVVAAKRALTVEEMNITIALTKKKSSRSYEDLDLDLLSEENREFNLRDICGFFITIQKSKVSLIHQTAREFLLSTFYEAQSSAGLGSGFKWYHSVNVVDAEHTLAQACITLLSFEIYKGDLVWTRFTGLFSEWQNLRKHWVSKYPLLEYAAVHWPEHHCASQQLSKNEELDNVISLCDVQQTCYHTWYFIYWYSKLAATWQGESRPCLTSLILASSLGFVKAVEHVLHSLASRYRGQITSCEESDVYVAVNTSVEYFGSALVAASARGYLEVVIKLLDAGANANIEGGKYRTALHAALAEGHEQIAQLLIQRGADINAEGNHHPPWRPWRDRLWSGRPLHAAVAEGDISKVADRPWRRCQL